MTMTPEQWRRAIDGEDDLVRAALDGCTAQIIDFAAEREKRRKLTPDEIDAKLQVILDLLERRCPEAGEMLERLVTEVGPGDAEVHEMVQATREEWR